MSRRKPEVGDAVYTDRRRRFGVLVRIKDEFSDVAWDLGGEGTWYTHRLHPVRWWHVPIRFVRRRPMLNGLLDALCIIAAVFAVGMVIVWGFTALAARKATGALARDLHLQAHTQFIPEAQCQLRCGDLPAVVVDQPPEAVEVCMCALDGSLARPEEVQP